jgi:hypothetical protein
VAVNQADRVDRAILTEAINRFENAEAPDVIIRRTEWPEFGAFTAAYHELRRASDDSQSNESILDDLRRWGACLRLLRNSLADPSHPSLQLADESTWMSPSGGDLANLQEAARSAARGLGASPNRALGALADFFSPLPRLRWPASGLARVVVPRGAIEATDEALSRLSAEGVSWEVCSLSEARHRDSCTTTVVVGAPEYHLGWHLDYATRSRIVSWLLNAPMSPHIIFLRWYGRRRFESDDYEPFPGASLLDPREWNDSTTDEAPVPHDEPQRPLPSSRPSHRPSSAAASDRDALRAIDFRLPDRLWVSFGVEGGPLPSRIDEDAEFEPRVETSVPATQLRRGDTLVIISPDQERTLRNELCRQWLDSEASMPSFDEAWATIAAYKSAVRRHLAMDDALRALTRRGLSEAYLRSQFARSAPSSWAMAPRDRDNFELLSAAAGWQPPEDAWRHVQALRSGFTHAGHEIGQRLRAAVADDLSWLEPTDHAQIARLEVADVGQVMLAPILEVIEETAWRKEGELGVVLRN